MAYIILRGRWCNIIVLNAHAPTEDKIDDIKGSLYEELEQVFDKIPKYHMTILLGDGLSALLINHGVSGLFKFLMSLYWTQLCFHSYL
jgi:hypothetical protein